MTDDREGVKRVLSRTRVISRLRLELLQRTDESHSICLVAAREGIFCRGFARWSVAELEERHAWMLADRPGITRPELERLANTFELGRQFITGSRLACDHQPKDPGPATCRGWEGFSDHELERFFLEIVGEDIEIRPEADTGQRDRTGLGL